MITRNDLIGMLGNKMRNEVIKAIIRSNKNWRQGSVTSLIGKRGLSTSPAS